MTVAEGWKWGAGRQMGLLVGAGVGSDDGSHQALPM